ncbi:MAG: hypothetical protein AB7W47_17705 [Calditrichaceae bacterium]
MFDTLSDKARLWIYGFSNQLSSSEKGIVQAVFDEFMKSWNAHGEPVKGDFEILYDRFVMLAAEDTVSGCSIDSSTRILKNLKLHHGIDAMDQNLIFYKISEIRSVNRQTFQSLVNRDLIKPDTIVFNLSLTLLKELRSGLFERPFSESWHKEAFLKSA